jgi:flagellar hook assembly protein FlgD
MLNKIIKLVLVIFLCGCATAKTLKQPVSVVQSKRLLISMVGLNKKSFDPLSKQAVIIKFKPSHPCAADLFITDIYGRQARRLLDNSEIGDTVNQVNWDGKDDSGQTLNPGVYFYVIKLKDKTGQVFEYNPYQRTQGIEIKPITGWCDPAKKEIYYRLSQAAMVRVRVGLSEGGPLLVTPFDWAPKSAGEYHLSWNGKDSGGFFDISNHPKRNVVIFAYSLADNSVILEGKPSVQKANLEKALIFDPSLPPGRYHHALHSPAVCHEPRINLEFPETGFTKDGLPIVKKMVNAKITIDPTDSLAMENSRYEIMLFVDTKFLFEDEAGFSPFNYRWDTSRLSAGEHFLTVNIDGYDDHCGVITKKILVEK